MDAASLFLATLDDLDCCSQRVDEYSILRTAGLMRLLLLDEKPLADQLNRQHRIRLEFEVSGHYGTRERLELPPFAEHLVLATVNEGFAPEFFPGIRTERVSRARLLSLVVIVLRPHAVTVLELIKHMAYVGGVVHAGAAEEPKDEALLALRRTVQLGGLPACLGTLRGIARVVHRGLVPLRDAVSRGAT